MMSSDTVLSPEAVSGSRSGDRISHESSSHTPERDGNGERKRSFSELLEDSILDSFYVDAADDDVVEEIDDSKDDFVIIKENKNKKRKIPSGSRNIDLATEVLLSIDSEDETDAEESEKEEIEILSETKLDKAELLRREQKFRKLTCPVCLDSPDVIIATQCGHLFCCDCIIRALASSKSKSVHSGTCPVCRKNVRYKDLQVLSIKHLK